MKRRTFLRTTTGALCRERGPARPLSVFAACGSLAGCPAGRAADPAVLVLAGSEHRDIAHTPGVLTLLERHIPEAEVTLWASGDLSAEVAAMEHRRFPRLEIVKGTIGADGRASNQDLADAVARADFLLHGSGPSLVAAKDVAAFVKHTGKPFGVYGITHGSFLSGNDRELLSQAKFVFFRGLGLAGPGQGGGRHVPRDGVWPGRSVCL